MVRVPGRRSLPLRALLGAAPVALGLTLALTLAAGCHHYVTTEQQGLIPKSGDAASGKGDGGTSGAGATVGDKRLSVTGAGSSLERITTDPVDELSPDVNKDGTAVLFQVETYESGGKLAQQTIVGVNPSRAGGRTLYTSEERFAHSPTWMPDGQSYVYVTNAMGPLAVVRALTSTPNAAMAVIVSSDLAPEPQTPTISPDGSRIAFSMRSPDGGRNIAVVGSDGSRFTILGEGRTPSWSPDGKQLAFVRTVSGYNHVFLVDPATGTGLIQLTSGKWDCDHPSWAPDSAWIVFASNRGYEDLKLPRDRVLHLFAIKRDGTGLVQLTQGQSMAGAPSWGKDGWVYFASNREGNYDIWRMKPGVEVGSGAGPAASASASAAPSASASASAAPTASASAAPTASATPSATATAMAEPVGCQTDFDCKGDRVCEWGNCIVPKSGQQKQVTPRTPPKK